MRSLSLSLSTRISQSPAAVLRARRGWLWPRAFALAVAWAAALILPPAAFALDPDRAVTQYVHASWTTEEGLPQNSVSSIAQTGDGYLWVGMNEGLVRFDGVRFELFGPNTTPAMRAKSVSSLVTDGAGGLWLASHGGGVVRAKAGVWTAYGAREGLASDAVGQVYADRQGRLWASTARGLGLLSGGRFRTYTTQDGLSADDAAPLVEDRRGNVWLGSRAGLNRWRDGKVTVYTTQDGLPHDVVYSAYEDRQGRLWIGTRAGLAEWREGRFVAHPISGGASGHAITCMLGDRDGNLWLGTSGGGLLRYRDGRVDVLGAGEGFAEITSLYEDREGSLWVGTISDGLHRLSNGKFLVYGTKEGLSNDATYSAYEDAKGAVWIGTYGGGLNRLQAGVVRTYTARDGLRSENVSTVLGDRAGNLWISTQGGLHRLQYGKIRAYTRLDGLAETLTTALLQDRSGRLWVANREGLHRFDGERFHAYTRHDGLPSNFVLALAEGRDGSLWIGTYDGGLSRWKDGRFTTYTAAGLAAQPIACLYEDDEGTLWIGTFGGGLVRRTEAGRFTAYTTRAGLFDDTVFNLLEDGRNNLWLSSNRGIFRVSKDDLDAFARESLKAVRTVVYGKADGMRSQETNGGGMAVKHRDGRLWFPTMQGVAIVDPERLDANPLPPPVVVEELRVRDRSLPLQGRIELAPGTSNVEIRYTALSLVAPEKVAFRYRLEGLDEDWVEAGTRRIAYYTNLDPGRYRFRVKASNNDGVWNEADARLGFAIRPRFYQTTWFALLCGAGVLMIGWGAHRVRLALVEAKAAVLEERNRIAQEIHDGLTQELGGITMQLEAASEQIETAADLQAARRSASCVERARNLTNNALEELHRSIWALRPALLEQTDLSEALGRLVEQLDSAAGTELSFTVNGTPAELPRELERSALRIAQEAIFNATRHGRSHHVSVYLSYEPVILRLRVRDDGSGFDPGSPAVTRGPGFGLRGMGERVQKLGGTLSVKSEAGAGTEVTATFPRMGWSLRAVPAVLRRIAFGAARRSTSA